MNIYVSWYVHTFTYMSPHWCPKQGSNHSHFGASAFLDAFMNEKVEAWSMEVSLIEAF